MKNTIEPHYLVELDTDDLSSVIGGEQALVNGLSPSTFAFSCWKIHDGGDNVLGSKAQFACFDDSGKPAGAGLFNDGQIAPISE